MKDELGDRMKGYESAMAGARCMPMLPVLARIDGRAFSSFTRGMNRPFDERMSYVMIDTARRLVDETGALIGYTQSDEITLAWFAATSKSQIWFDGRIAKMTSQLAALATLYFYESVLESLPEYAKRQPTFDARVWQVPNLSEAANVFLWREWDATKNSISMAAGELYSHRALMGKSGKEKQEMLFQKGINWSTCYPDYFKRGTYIQRATTTRAFTTSEIDQLPPKHAARANPELVVERSVVSILSLPPLSTIANRVDVLFNGSSPCEK
jgi:tRNA(His) guanylyltransferase